MLINTRTTLHLYRMKFERIPKKKPRVASSDEHAPAVRPTASEESRERPLDYRQPYPKRFCRRSGPPDPVEDEWSDLPIIASESGDVFAECGMNAADVRELMDQIDHVCRLTNYQIDRDRHLDRIARAVEYDPRNPRYVR